MKKSMSRIAKLLQFWLFMALNNLLKLFGIEKSSILMGKLLRNLGRYTSANRVIERNLSHIYPSMKAEEMKSLSEDIWENFGKYVGEFPFLDEEFLKKNTQRIE